MIGKGLGWRPSMRILDVAIVGAGTAGCAAALYLGRAGHIVTVFERVPDPGPVGAGVVMQPSGLSVLAELGLFEAVAARGARLDRLRCVSPSGRTILQIPYGDLGYGIALHRGVLFQALHRTLAKEQIAVECGKEIIGMSPSLGDRITLTEATGKRLGHYDLVVVADGARSRLRDDLDLPLRRSARAYAWGALWFIAQDLERRFEGELYQVVDGPQRLLGLLPTGVGPSGNAPLVSLFWSLRADRLEAWRNDFHAWRRQIVRYVPDAAAVVEQIINPSDVTFSSYYDVTVDPWHTRNVVYLGDAAHATSPQLGQGCNLALIDAQALAASLAWHDRVPTALADYSRRRRRHLAFYQRATRWLTPFFQGDSRVLGLLRDIALPLALRVPWIRHQMALTMCGLKLGTFGALAVPALPLVAGGLGAPPLDSRMLAGNTG
jgi:2-polyprenyl-6-methoxyphenol hydroxylase-like FAD-dependent oxidoreductase